MSRGELQGLASLLARRNALDHQIAALTGRPVVSGHLGEYIAAKIFGIELESTAVAAAIDGRFRDGQLVGRTVNVKWYLKREGLLDVTAAPILDYYLVLAGPPSAAVSSAGGVRPWCISLVHLFDAHQLLQQLSERGVKIGTGSSVRAEQWTAAEVYPHANSPVLILTGGQRDALALFSPSAIATSDLAAGEAGEATGNPQL